MMADYVSLAQYPLCGIQTERRWAIAALRFYFIKRSLKDGVVVLESLIPVWVCLICFMRTKE